MDDNFGPFAAFGRLLRNRKKNREVSSLERAFKSGQSKDEIGKKKYNYPVKSDYAWRRYRDDQAFLKEFNEYEVKKKLSLSNWFFTDNDEYEEWLPYNSLGVDWNGVEYNQTSQ